MLSQVTYKIQIKGPHKPLEVEINPGLRTAYVRVRRGKVSQTIEHGHGILLDVDGEGRLLGIEFVNLKRRLVARIKDIADEYLLPSDDADEGLGQAIKQAQTELRQHIPA